MFANNNFYILLGIVCCLQQLNVNAYPTINIRRLFDSAIENRYKKSDINFPQTDEDVLELDHLKQEEPSSIADESNEGGDIHFEIPSVNAAPPEAEQAIGVGDGVGVGIETPSQVEDTAINPTDLLPELEQQLEQMTTTKASSINNVAAAGGQKEGEKSPEGIGHHRPPMLPHHDGGKVNGGGQQQNGETSGTGEGSVSSPILTKPFYGAARLAFGQNPEVQTTSTTTSTTTTVAVPTSTLTSPTTNENIPESIITSPPSAQSIETIGMQPQSATSSSSSASTSAEDNDNNKEQVSSQTNKNVEEHNSNPSSSASSSSSSSSSSANANANEKEQLGDVFIPQMEATKPGPERRSMNTMPIKTAESLLKHKDGQYSSFDMAQYVFWTGDEAGVAKAVEEFIDQGLMSREGAIKFLRDIRLGIEYLQNSYANRIFPEQLRDNFIKKHSHNTIKEMPTHPPPTTTTSTTTTTTTTRRPTLSTTNERPRTPYISREYAPAQYGYQMKQHLDKTLESLPSNMRFQDVNNVHNEREHSDRDEAAGRAKIAKFLYTEFSLEEVIYQLGKVMFSESLAHGSDQAQRELQRLTDFLEEEGKQGMISPELQKKVLDVLLQALSDTLVEHPELLEAARTNLGSSFNKLPDNSMESKN